MFHIVTISFRWLENCYILFKFLNPGGINTVECWETIANILGKITKWTDDMILLLLKLFPDLAIHYMPFQMILITSPMVVSISFSFSVIFPMLGLFWLSFSTHNNAIWMHVFTWWQYSSTKESLLYVACNLFLQFLWTWYIELSSQADI